MPLYLKKKKSAAYSNHSLNVLRQTAELKLFKWKTYARELVRMVWSKARLITF